MLRLPSAYPQHYTQRPWHPETIVYEYAYTQGRTSNALNTRYTVENLLSLLAIPEVVSVLVIGRECGAADIYHTCSCAK